MDKKTLGGMSLFELLEMQTALLKYPEDQKHRDEILKEIRERQKRNQEELNIEEDSKATQEEGDIK